MAHILIIEDDPALQEAYSFILKTARHDVTSAYNGQEGLALTDDHPFDIILLDVHMPVMDGLEFLKHFQPIRPTHTKIIVFSNMVEPEITKQASKLGADQSILKSTMTPSAMLSLITKTLATP